MDTVTSLTNAASRAIWGEDGTGTTSNETAGREPVAGQMGNVEAGEPYDKGNLETPTNEKTPSSTIADSKSGNVDLLEHDNSAKTGGKSLYNPILPSKPGDTASPNNVNSSGVSSTGANSENAAEKSQSQQSAVKSEDMSDTAASETSGSKPKSREENAAASEGGEGGAQKTTQSSTATKNEGERDLAKLGPKIDSDLNLPDESETGESKPTAAGSNAGAGKATGAATAGTGDGAGDGDGASADGDKADSSPSDSKRRKSGIKDKIKAKLHIH